MRIIKLEEIENNTAKIIPMTFEELPGVFSAESSDDCEENIAEAEEKQEEINRIDMERVHREAAELVQNGKDQAAAILQQANQEAEQVRTQVDQEAEQMRTQMAQEAEQNKKEAYSQG
ncbi:MAG TPA: hypothetical protein PLN69_03910, partial [bacterium]|nr:hypothetical protein [bacterium]